MASIVGLAIFTHHWYWYPCLNFLTLSLTPTAVIGVNKDIKVPKSFDYTSNAKPSMFAYPEFI
jgi:26S proteasome regulatory subunit N2